MYASERRMVLRENRNYYGAAFIISFFTSFASPRLVSVEVPILSEGKNSAEPKMNYYVSLERRSVLVFSYSASKLTNRQFSQIKITM